MELLEIRPNRDADPGGRKLSDFLNAHFAWERAVVRRRDLMTVFAIVGVPVSVCVLLHLPEALTGIALMFHALVGGVALVAWLNERTLRDAVRETERQVDARRIGTDSHGGSRG